MCFCEYICTNKQRYLISPYRKQNWRIGFNPRWDSLCSLRSNILSKGINPLLSSTTGYSREIPLALRVFTQALRHVQSTTHVQFLDGLKAVWWISGLQLQNTLTTSLQSGETPCNECPRYDTKQSDGEAPVKQELCGARSTRLLLSLTGSFWPGVVAPDRFVCLFVCLFVRLFVCYLMAYLPSRVI